MNTTQRIGALGMMLSACASGPSVSNTGTPPRTTVSSGATGGGGHGGGTYSAQIYGVRGTLPRAPFSVADLELLRKTVLLTDDDVAALRRSKDILTPQVEDILDTWYGFVGSNPHLLAYFSNAQKEPQADYLDAVRKRFGQWILDTADATFDQDWIDYHFEIGRRHHRVGKTKTDNAKAVDHIHFRYLFALIFPISHTLRPYLAKGGASAEDVDAMHQAWVKSLLIQVTLWSYPYVRDGDF